MSAMSQKAKSFCLWKVLLFCVLFACVFLGVQYVLMGKYQPEDCWPERYADYAAEPANTVDVLFVGSSQSYWGVSPMALWHEAGITSVNMSGVMHQHNMVYEQLRALLALNTPPKCAVFNISSLVQMYTVNDEKLRPVWEQFISTLPTWDQKQSAYHTMCAEATGKLDKLSFFLPLLRYHSRWSELTADDFRVPADYRKSYRPFLKGQMPMMEGINITEFVDAAKELEGYNGLLPQSMEGWKRVFALCRENGIIPVALIMPRFDSFFKGAPLEDMLAFLDENQVDVINYMDEVSLNEMGWDYRHHFKDREHLNFRGSLYGAQDLAWQLSYLCDLQDHRGDPAYSQWEADWEQFEQTYGDLLSETLGDEQTEFLDSDDESDEFCNDEEVF